MQWALHREGSSTNASHGPSLGIHDARHKEPFKEAIVATCGQLSRVQATKDQRVREGCYQTCRTGHPAQCHPGAAAGQQP